VEEPILFLPGSVEPSPGPPPNVEVLGKKIGTGIAPFSPNSLQIVRESSTGYLSAKGLGKIADIEIRFINLFCFHLHQRCYIFYKKNETLD
jgi:hypothetical protein